jgi:uncharacterized tellurite resistance protein B-like protein
MAVKPSEEEEKYFQSVAEEQRKRLRKEFNTNAARAIGSQMISESVGAGEDQDIVDAIRGLGFDEDTARIFDMLPLIHVVWADGTVDRRERAKVLNILKERGIVENSQAWMLAEALLEERPSEEFMEETLRILRTIAQRSPGRADSVVDLCMVVAEASGGFLGLLGDPISAVEKDAIQRVADSIGDTAQRRFRMRFNKA